MRVIAGSARGTVLVAPRGLSTRPTGDRMKENLFNIIAPHVPGARFLDLYSGSGAVGIEALSRGAECAVLVENAAEALKSLHTNLAKARLAHKAQVLGRSVAAACALLGSQGRRFDIIFLDPPYADTDIRAILSLIADKKLAAPHGMLILEMPAHTQTYTHENFTVSKEKIYSDTKFVWYAEVNNI